MQSNTFALSVRKKMHNITQGVALGYGKSWAFFVIIGGGSAIKASFIAFALHDNSARPGQNRNLNFLIVSNKVSL